MTTKIKIKIFLSLFLLILVSLAGLFLPEANWGLRYLITSDVKPAANDLDLLSKVHCPNCNLIFISIDTIRADAMGFMGSELGLTPNLDAIASKSAVFKNASSNAYYTTPSHMTAFTCLYPQTHNIFGNYIFWNLQYKKSRNFPVSNAALDEKYQTLPQYLKADGYSTYWFAPTASNYFPMEQGFSRGIDHIQDSVLHRAAFKNIFSNGKAFSEDKLPSAAELKEPFYMFFHTFAAHSPYLAKETIEPKPLALITEPQLAEATRSAIENLDGFFFEPDLMKAPQFEKFQGECKDPSTYKKCTEHVMSVDRFLHSVGRVQGFDAIKILRNEDIDIKQRGLMVTQYRQAYNAGIQYVDEQIGELWKSFDQKGILKNSVIVIFSDHGEEIFEHKFMGHLSFYENEVRVPLLIYTPNIEKTIQINRPVSLVDVMPISLDLIDKKAPKQCQGPVANPDMLQNYIYGYALGADYIKDENWKLMTRPNGSFELYYLPLDPKEENNLVKLRLPFIAKKKDFLLYKKKELLSRLAMEAK